MSRLRLSHPKTKVYLENWSNHFKAKEGCIKLKEPNWIDSASSSRYQLLKEILGEEDLVSYNNKVAKRNMQTRIWVGIVMWKWENNASCVQERRLDDHSSLELVVSTK